MKYKKIKDLKEEKIKEIECKIWDLSKINKNLIHHKKLTTKSGKKISYIQIDKIKNNKNSKNLDKSPKKSSKKKTKNLKKSSKTQKTPKNSKTLILLHGYASSKNSFFKLSPFLQKKYNLILLDLPSTNFNTKEKTLPFNCLKTCLDYFIREIEEIVKKLNLSKFSILGHSLGGFIAAHYYEKFYYKIENVFLLSPAGFHFSKINQKIESEKKLDKYFFLRRWFMKYVGKKLFEDKKSVFEIFFGFLTKFLMKRYFKMKRMNFDKNESDLFVKLIYEIIDTKQSGEKSLGYLLDFGIKSKKPIQEILEKKHIKNKKICLIYGDRDWMDSKKVILTIKNNNLNVDYFFIKNSGHQLIFQNPEDISKVILNFQEKSELI